MAGRVLSHREIMDAKQQVITESTTLIDLITTVEEYRTTLSALTEDSQHIDHDCGDLDICPVLRARRLLAK